ncbi:hypothetical protein P4S72_25985 [Vibrio sp. PP-XX7]
MKNKQLSKKELPVQSDDFHLAKIMFRHILPLILAVTGSSLLVILCISFDYTYGARIINETSMTEYMQQILLGIAVIAFYRVKTQRYSLRHGAILISGFFLVLSIRELDFLFDYIRHGFWVYPALAVTGAAIFYAAGAKKQIVNQLAEILSAPNMRILVCGLFLLLVFSRLFGMGPFWKMIMQDHYMRGVKDVAEEGIELLCYGLIAYASVSTQLYLKRCGSTLHQQTKINEKQL